MSRIGRYVEERFLAPERRMKASHFAQFHLAPGTVVFLGDSITEGGHWDEWFPEARVANRGIGGDTTAGILARLSTAVQGPPSQVFLLIGTNDLTRRVPPDEIAANVTQVLAGIREAAPEAEMVLQSVMPRTAKLRERILDLNARYRRLAPLHGARYLDLWPALADHRGALREEFTQDQLHLGGAGYRAWVAVLRDHARTT